MRVERFPELFQVYDLERILSVILPRLPSLPSLSDCQLIEGVKIDDIVYDEFFRSFSNPEFFHSLLIDKSLQKIALDKCKVLFFRLEFQPHERSILYNTRDKVKLIGFQHSAPDYLHEYHRLFP